MFGNSDGFVKHGPCESCGSKDNVAWYKSGSGYCFGCGHYYKASKIASRLPSAPVMESEKSNDASAIRSPPDDIGTAYNTNALNWCHQYDVGVVDLIKHNVKWSPGREQLIYMFYGAGKDLVLWQARNFKQGTDHKHRFFTGGTPEKVVAAYYPEQGSNTACLVEDCISGIKLAKSGYVGIPCFSSSMSPEKLRRIGALYDRVIVWLDRDKFDSGVKMSNKLKLLGCDSRAVHTTYDPKEYNIAEIVDWIR